MVSCLYDSGLEEALSIKPHSDINWNLREWNPRKLPALRPVGRRRGIDGDSLIGTDVETIRQVSVLTLLLGVHTSKVTQVLPTDSLVDGSTTTRNVHGYSKKC